MVKRMGRFNSPAGTALLFRKRLVIIGLVILLAVFTMLAVATHQQHAPGDVLPDTHTEVDAAHAAEAHGTAHHGMSTQMLAFGWVGLATILVAAALLHSQLRQQGLYADEVVATVISQGGGLPLAIGTVIPLIIAGAVSVGNPQAFEALILPIHDPVIQIWIAAFIGLAVAEIRAEADHLLANRRAASVIGLATLMGIPVLVFLVLAGALNVDPSGWLIVVATDIVFSRAALQFMGARKAKRQLATAIALGDDLGGLIAIMAFLASRTLAEGGGLAPVLTSFATLAAGVGLSIIITRWFNRRKMSIGWYALPAVIGWLGFYLAGYEPVLGFVPVMVTIRKEVLHELLQAGTWAMFPILGFFAFVTGELNLSVIGPTTAAVFIGLTIGKLVGIGTTLTIVKRTGYHDPGLTYQEIWWLAGVMGIGFKVAGINATLVYSGATRAAALLATNATILWGIGLVIVKRITDPLHPKSDPFLGPDADAEASLEPAVSYGDVNLYVESPDEPLT